MLPPPNLQNNDLVAAIMVNRLLPHTQRKKSVIHLIVLLILCSLFLVPQIYGAFRINHFAFHQAFEEIFDIPPRRLEASESAKLSNSQSELSSITKPNGNETFGACLMLKEDNDLLYEWLAYHYTVLPLRHVYVASDVGNSQDPSEVLRRWTAAKTDLQYWIKNVSDFAHRHGHEYGTADTIQDVHHEFVHRKSLAAQGC